MSRLWAAVLALLAASAALFAVQRAELKQARLSAHLLNVTACGSIAPH